MGPAQAPIRRHELSLPALALRLGLALALLVALGQVWGRDLIEAVLPVFRAEIAWLDGNYQVLDLHLSHEGADRVVALEMGIKRFIVVGGQVLYPDPRARSRVTTLAGHVLVPAMLCFAVAAARPLRRRGEYLLRFAFAIPLALGVMVLDVPFVLLGEVWNIHVAAFEPERFSLLLMWKDFLQGGGRFALGLGAGLLAISCARACTRRSARQ